MSTNELFNEETASPPPGVLVADYFVEPPGYHVRRARGTRDWLVTFTCAGEGVYRSATTTYVCGKHDVVLLGPGVPHDYATTPTSVAWEFWWAHFTPRPSWTAWLQLPEAAPGIRVLHVGERTAQQRIERAFERVVRDSRGLIRFHDELALNALEEIVLLLAQTVSETHDQHTDARVEAVVQQLTSSMNTPISIPSLARTVALSPSRLAHLFKQQMGEPIGQYHLKLRLRHAARLLTFSTRPIHQIAQDIGFQSPFTFSRQFKAYYGVSPLHYRTQSGQM